MQPYKCFQNFIQLPFTSLFFSEYKSTVNKPAEFGSGFNKSHGFFREELAINPLFTGITANLSNEQAPFNNPELN